jgi:hypothetical protein
MVIDQRNAGASITQTTADLFPTDRWNITGTVTSKFTAQQNAGSVTPPAGYVNYLGMTSSSAYTVGAAESFIVRQKIEGFNTADLAWGTANAKTVTLSFQVYSSLTGTFGGALINSAGNRSYPFSYTISSANTWEQKTITIAGDTSGTWVTNSGIGIQVVFNMGTGATYSGTAGSWAATYYASATGAVSVVGTASATFYITGVQLEAGSTASPFEYRSYGTELMLCQRYLPALLGGPNFYSGQATGTTSSQISIPLKVTSRVAPTGITVVSTTANFLYTTNGTSSAVTTITFTAAGTDSAFLSVATASGLVAGNATGFLMQSPSTIVFTGCEL